MSLEQAIHENTVALRELAQMIQAMQAPRMVVEQGPVTLDDIPETRQEPVQVEKPKRASKAKAEKPAAEKAPEPKAEEPAPSSSAKRADVTAALTKVSALKGKPVAMSLLAEAGGKSLGEIPEANYGALLAACEAALNG